MPTYQYSCTECGHFLEVVQSFSDDSLTVCPECEGRLRKVFNAVGVVFKGSGFYRNDSRGPDTSAGSGDSSDSGSKKSDKADTSGSKETSTSGSKDSSGSTGSSGSSDSKGSQTSKGSTPKSA